MLHIWLQRRYRNCDAIQNIIKKLKIGFTGKAFDSKCGKKEIRITDGIESKTID